jgi:hypothetical protein
MAKRIMRVFKMNEISAVDRPAQAHAKSVIMKRADEPDGGTTVEKGMYEVSRFADMISSLGYMVRESAMERDFEGDNSQIPERLKSWLQSGAAIFEAMASEEIDELLAASMKKRGEVENDATNTLKGNTMTEEETLAHEAELAKKDSKQEEADGDTKKPAFPKGKPAKNPDKTDDKVTGTEKALELPEGIQKRLDAAEAMEKRLATLEDEREGVAFGKRAIGLGLVEAHGEILRKAYKGDPAAIGELETIIKGLTAQIDAGKLFKEFGTTRGGDATSAEGALKAKAAEYQTAQTAIGKKCSAEQAWTAVYTAPTNLELKKRYDAEDIAKRSGRAA